jgi:beta-lactamase class A
MRISSIVLLTLLNLIFTSQVLASPDSAWVSEIRGLEMTYGGHLGMMAKDLKTGEIISYNATERFPTASVIKLPVMAAFFSLAEEGKVDPAVQVLLRQEDKKPGSGILQMLSDGKSLTLADAVRLMIVLSDNTATNLVLDQLGDTHEARLRNVNEFLVKRGLHNTRILNRLYSVETKQSSPEALRYGVGVSTPEDMVMLLEALYRKTLASPASCDQMLEILKQQFYGDMIPRFLPVADCKYLQVAHKTGGVQETKADVGLILSDRADIAIAIFVDKHPDHEEDDENLATLLAARVARTAWNHFTGMTGSTERKVNAGHVDWNSVPGGSWGIYRSPAAPFPHPDRAKGFTRKNGTVYSFFPHYADSSIVVFVPKGFKELAGGSNMIVHFHGHLGDNLAVLEKDSMLQAVTSQKVNALLVLAQGPYRSRDDFGGKMEDDGGFKRLVEDVLATMQREEIVKTTAVNRICVSGFSGGYRPAAFVLAKGGLSEKITDLFLFDALYANQEYFRDWLLSGKGRIFGAFTDHLEKEYTTFAAEVRDRAGDRVSFTKTSVPHDAVPRTFIANWLSRLDREWKLE